MLRGLKQPTTFTILIAWTGLSHRVDRGHDHLVEGHRLQVPEGSDLGLPRLPVQLFRVNVVVVYRSARRELGLPRSERRSAAGQRAGGGAASIRTESPNVGSLDSCAKRAEGRLSHRPNNNVLTCTVCCGSLYLLLYT